ncbi:MAG TPA: molybdenum-binding protein [Deltaproteobacteria bacterium]|nr:molybdenum-binding protein [Deltaproteobacteria bacterium]
MQVCYRIWLDNKGKAFGEGPYRLLKGVAETGSLYQAAARLRMSYRKAWNVLNDVEKRLGFTLLERKVGGPSGGGSTVTSRGQELVRHYECFRQEIDQQIRQTFHKHFGHMDFSDEAPAQAQ